MSGFTYASIEPLIASQEQKGSQVTVQFRCPESGVEACGRGRLKKSASVASTAERSAKKNLWGGLQRSVTKTVGSVFGSGAVGRFARDVVGGAMTSAGPSSAFSAEELQAAVLDAFETVRARFSWDESRGCWIGVVPEP